MLWTLVVILVVLWALGLAFKIASGLIHLLLVIALVLIVFQADHRPQGGVIATARSTAACDRAGHRCPDAT